MWLSYDYVDASLDELNLLKQIVVTEQGDIIQTIINELKRFVKGDVFVSDSVLDSDSDKPCVKLTIVSNENLSGDGYSITKNGNTIEITALNHNGLLYGTFELIRLISTNKALSSELSSEITVNPNCDIRMINHWDNLDGSIERGYAGNSIFFEGNNLTENLQRIHDYGRFLASIGINCISINNVNVHWEETFLMDKKRMYYVKTVSDILKLYGVKTFISANYAAPVQLSGLKTADPLDEGVRAWWRDKAKEIYEYLPDFGGFVIKADSENREGPFTYGRNHADGANMLAEALAPYGGIVVWRCFVYNCKQDWRDRSIDRAKAAYDNFKHLDGLFMDNVYLQVKNGPMDFQVREPVSPLFGAMPNTNLILEFQITQEYTGQQKHLCYLLPQWKDVVDFDTHANGNGSYVRNTIKGFAAVTNIGNDECWTGHILAGANLYGYGRLCFSPSLSPEEIAEEWIRLSFGNNDKIVSVIKQMLLESWGIYEKYTSPLGIGWMVNTGHHYGPCVDGYEYSMWGTYHRSDRDGLGVDRSDKGTGYALQYFEPNASIYNNIESCPDELLLFFHYIRYDHVLKSGKTVIQHIYSSHFEGVDDCEKLIKNWESLKGIIDDERYEGVRKRLQIQLESAIEWRDQINTYYYRMSGVKDELNRKIY